MAFAVRAQCERGAVTTPGTSQSAKDGTQPGVRVLKVWSRVALEGQHSIEVEDVVALTFGRQIGVLDGGARDIDRQFSPRRLVTVEVPRHQRGVRPGDRFVKQSRQPDRKST